MKKSELVKAAKEVNKIIEPPIDTKMGVEELEAELLEAAEAVSEEDGLSEETMNVLAQIQAKYAEDEDEDDEAADSDAEDEDEDDEAADSDEEGDDEEESEGDEEAGDEDEDAEGEDEEEEDGDESDDDEDGEEPDDVEENAPEPTPKKGKGKAKEEKPSKAPKAEKPAKTPKTEKPTKSDKPTKTKDQIFGGNKTVARVEFFIDLINEGRYSKKDLVELAVKEFPDATVAALSTILSDGTNPKYCRFPVLIYIDKEDGNIVKFTDIKCERGNKITKATVKHESGVRVPKKKEAPAKAAPEKEAKAGKKAGKKK